MCDFTLYADASANARPCVSCESFASRRLIELLNLGRELFPSSDCLKGSQREGMLQNEILAYSPDIACLQVSD